MPESLMCFMIEVRLRLAVLSYNLILLCTESV